MVVYMAELGWRVHPLRQNILYTTFGKANRETTSSKTDHCPISIISKPHINGFNGIGN